MSFNLVYYFSEVLHKALDLHKEDGIESRFVISLSLSLSLCQAVVAFLRLLVEVFVS